MATIISDEASQVSIRYSLATLPEDLADEPGWHFAVYDNRYQKRIESWLSYEEAQRVIARKLGEPIEYPRQDREASAADAKHQYEREQA